MSGAVWNCLELSRTVRSFPGLSGSCREISGVSSTAARSLVAYDGTVAPRRRLDVGERSSIGEGLQTVRWAVRMPVAAKPSPV